jgi:hypothetical protein
VEAFSFLMNFKVIMEGTWPTSVIFNRSVFFCKKAELDCFSSIFWRIKKYVC